MRQSQKEKPVQLDKNTMKKLALLVVLGVGLSWLLPNIQLVGSGLFFIWGLLRPFVVGVVIAFVLNIPMRAIEKHLFRGRGGRLRRPVSFTLTVVLVLGVLALVGYLVIPQLVSTIMSLGAAMPGYIQNAQQKIMPYLTYFPTVEDSIRALNWNTIEPQLLTFLQNGALGFASSAYTVASRLIGGTVSFFIGIIFAAYILLDKEHLGAQLKGLLKAYLPAKRYRGLLGFGRLCSSSFSRFVSGQCTEAVVLGLIFCVVLFVGQFEYALLIAVLIAFLSLIPIFGATIACAIGALLLLMAQGWVRALVFVAIFLIIQQIDGNFIYPHIVGTSVGLPAIWVLVAVTLGAGLAGLTGMLVCIPMASVVYTLVHRSALARLHAKGIVSPVRELGRAVPGRGKRRAPAGKGQSRAAAPANTPAAKPQPQGGKNKPKR